LPVTDVFFSALCNSGRDQPFGSEFNLLEGSLVASVQRAIHKVEIAFLDHYSLFVKHLREILTYDKEIK
jgi:hypothetical protein